MTCRGDAELVNDLERVEIGEILELRDPIT